MANNVNLRIHFTLHGKYLLKLSIKTERNSCGKFRVINSTFHYVKSVHICSYSVRMREKPDHNNSEYGVLTTKANSNFSGEEGRGGKYQSVVAILLLFFG